jgi:integral membrane protein TIGR01906
MKHPFKPSDILIGILFTVFFLSFGLIIAINFRSLYYFDINYLHITQTSGYDRKTILENYNALIDYSSPFFKGKLVFPTFSSSPNALTHFAEVKRIFILFYYIACFCLFALILIIRYKHTKKDTSYLKVSSIISLVFPIFVSIGCTINFDRAFLFFHEIFFRNSYWMFDPYTDPIISILPETFFLHCAIVIIAFMILGSFCLFLLTKAQKQKHLK